MKNNMYHQVLMFIAINCVITFATINAKKPMVPATIAAKKLYDTIKQPHQFLLGASTSTHQCSNQCNRMKNIIGKHICDWSAFVDQHSLDSTENFQQYPANIMEYGTHYIDQLKDILGINALRISIEWSLVQPKGPETYCSAILDQYAMLFTHMIKRGITPIICFHHYTSPCWFAELNGFEEDHNIPFFTTYCSLVYSYLMNAVLNDQEAFEMLTNELDKNNRPPLWATFNSPEGVAFKGYKTNEAPPSNPKKNGLTWVAQVLKNMLEAHVSAYIALKEIHHAQPTAIAKMPEPRIGFLKNITQLDIAYHNIVHRLCSPLTKICCLIGQDLQSDCIYRFFTTGKFNLFLPFITTSHNNPNAPYALDWIGVNYYSNQLLLFSSNITEASTSENGTDNSNYRIYAHGIYRAIKEIHQKLIIPLAATRNTTPMPVYITENGIATTNEEKRTRFYAEYIAQLTKAIKNGYPVQGYLTWTAFDNYEWPKPQEKLPIKRTYGLCNISPDGTTLTIKPGACYYRDIISYFMYLNKK